jgi:pimeloyl-ACP methyl ester carboxylesterase
MLNAGKIEQKLPAFAQVLEKRHSPNNWKEVLNHTATMLENLGKNNSLSLEDYKDITVPCLIMLGDRDKMITLQETVDVYNALPSASMAMLPDTPHPIEQVKIEALLFFINNFLVKGEMS